ncbi:MAG TPA: KpsF/GutQ family sugar-phosphate isomerase [Fimbriimonadaceae bacterium]|nr:KpsF/GutQ family sugar-phosphate isomerase [Fimbriimonadaceae bacterium]HRJ34008.1 KpsF/GutQ family sugar-phosphate isomerase [Fimbriimonadaceae bacterium]
MNRFRTSLQRVLLEEAEAIRALADRLDASFDQAVEWILQTRGRMACCGLGKSGHIARKTAGTLSSTGTPSFFLHAGEALHGDLGMLTAEDCVLMYSYSGESDELVRLFPAIQALGARTILVTGRPQSSAGRLAQMTLNVAVDREACPNNLAPTTSTTVMLAVSDALAVSVMEARGFGKEDYAKFHPGGALGKRLLLTVRDVMRSGPDLPLVSIKTPLAEVMRIITQAGAGAACVVDADDRLLGLISDGDLRRFVLDHRNELDAPAGAVMFPDPETMHPQLLAIEALEAFQNLPKKIGEMPVLEEGRVVGLLVLKDLLRSGIL